jgi:hypothetical protein
MSVIETPEKQFHWEAYTDLYMGARQISDAEEVAATGEPAERVGASIVDEFGEDLRRLADA